MTNLDTILKLQKDELDAMVALGTYFREEEFDYNTYRELKAELKKARQAVYLFYNKAKDD